MQKVKYVSIARESIALELPALKILEDYLVRCEKSLNGNPDKNEILEDLEVSIADRLKKMSGSRVVDEPTIKDVLAVIGEVEGAVDNEEPTDGSDTQQGGTSGWWNKIKPGLQTPISKDPDRKILDGVAAGVARRLDIDPFAVRAALIFFTLITDGGVIIFYILMMIVMPSERSNLSAEQIVSSKAQEPIKFSRLESLLRLTAKVLFGIVKYSIVLVTGLLGAILALSWAITLTRYLASPGRFPVFGETLDPATALLISAIGVVLIAPLLILQMVILNRKSRRLMAGIAASWMVALVLAAASLAVVGPRVERYLQNNKPQNSWIHTEVIDGDIEILCFLDCTEIDRVNIEFSDIVSSGVYQTFNEQDYEYWIDNARWNARHIDLPSDISKDDYYKKVDEIQEAYGNPLDVMFPKNGPGEFAIFTNAEEEPKNTLTYFVRVF